MDQMAREVPQRSDETRSLLEQSSTPASFIDPDSLAEYDSVRHSLLDQLDRLDRLDHSKHVKQPTCSSSRQHTPSRQSPDHLDASTLRVPPTGDKDISEVDDDEVEFLCSNKVIRSGD